MKKKKRPLIGKNVGGRPLKEFDKKSFEQLCKIQATKLELCQFFNTTDTAIERWCKRTYNGKGFGEVFALKRGEGKVSLRRRHWQEAVKKNPVPSIHIFACKNFLGMSDHPEGVNVHLTGKNGGPIETRNETMVKQNDQRAKETRNKMLEELRKDEEAENNEEEED